MAEKKPANRTLPLLPLRELLVFPHTVVPLFVGREKSIKALDDAMARNREIFLAAQKNQNQTILFRKRSMNLGPLRKFCSCFAFPMEQ